MTEDNVTTLLATLRKSLSAESDDPAAKVNLGFSNAYFNSLVPSMSSIVGPMFSDSFTNIGSLIAQSFDTTGIQRLIADMAPTMNLSKQFVERYALLGKQLYPSLSELYPTLEMSGILRIGNSELQKTVTSLTSSVARSVDASFTQTLLAQASTFRDELDHGEFEDITAEFLGQQPRVAESIERLPFLLNLSASERKLIVWFIGTIVAIYVAMGVVNITLDNPELGALAGAVGLSGPASGVVAAKATGKLLDKVSCDGSAGGPDDE